MRTPHAYTSSHAYPRRHTEFCLGTRFRSIQSATILGESVAPTKTTDANKGPLPKPPLPTWVSLMNRHEGGWVFLIPSGGLAMRPPPLKSSSLVGSPMDQHGGGRGWKQVRGEAFQ